MIKFIEILKLKILEYIHLILLVFILFSLYINNMPVNFQFEKFSNFIPLILDEDMARKYGIKDPKNSKLYSILAWLYGVIRSFLSPNFKTMLFKIVILIFIIGLLFTISYSKMFLYLGFFVSIISLIFWAILGASDWSDKDNTISIEIKKYFNNIQADISIPVLINVFVSSIIMVSIWYFLEYKGSYFSKHPSIMTLYIVSAILILYYRIDGIAFLLRDGIWKGYIRPFGEKWYENMLGKETNLGSKVSRWIAFGFYMIILGMICLVWKKPELFAEGHPGSGHLIKKYSIFNNLIEHTNHPKAIIIFYIWFFLLRTTYSGGWLVWFVFFTIIEVLYKNMSGVMKYAASKDPRIAQAIQKVKSVRPKDVFKNIKVSTRASFKSSYLDK